MDHDITGLHHVGHLVHDMGEALELYRRMGFGMPGPAYPGLGEPPEPFGVGNTHAYFSQGFIELVAAGGRVPADARVIPLRVPAERLPAFTQAVRRTAANLDDCLRRFEGVHILMFDAPGIEAAAGRLTAQGVGHGGVHATQRPIETADGVRMEPVRYLEIDGVAPGRVPEGRIGLALNAPDSSQGEGHPNGALELAECVLCVADEELDEVVRRYEAYLGRAADGSGAVRRVGLGGRAQVTLVAATGLDALLPGERAAALPGFAAYTVVVRDVTVTGRFLRERGFSVGRTAAGDVFVPAKEAAGVAIVFRQAD
ncbi:VOC family protein [Nonomuraea sp. NPDC050643]|uniref:VOC family protein n=1 Tax=Nonomuraea sp. NPDC050643 TaxID=3155660 RepID=UPI0033C76D29